MMSSRYGVLCFLLFFVILLLAYENYVTWSQPFERTGQKEAAKKPEVKSEPSPAMERPKQPSSGDAVPLIAQNNIFNPDRKEFPLLTVEQTRATAVARPQIILYGVIIADDTQTASIIHPGRPLQKGEREIKTLKLGDPIGDYKITKILPDRITVEAPGDSFEVLLYDPRLPKKRADVKTPSRPAEVTSIVPAPTVAPTAAPTPPAIAKPAPSQPVPSPPERPRDRVIETQLPRPAPPVSSPDAETWRGARPPRPAVPAESGRK